MGTAKGFKREGDQTCIREAVSAGGCATGLRANWSTLTSAIAGCVKKPPGITSCHLPEQRPRICPSLAASRRGTGHPPRLDGASARSAGRRSFDLPEYGVISIALGSLDDPNAVKLEFQCGTESRIDGLDDLPVLPDVPASGKWYAKIAQAVFQHPDHDISEWVPRTG